MIIDKRQLVAACQQRDPEAMKQLYVELAPTMLGVCMRYTHSRDEAQDLLHDGFIKVFENINKLNNPLALVSWIYQIMVNLSIDYVVQNSNLQYYDAEKMEGFEDKSDEEQLDLDKQAKTAEEAVRALQSLPDVYRAAFNMRAVEGMEYDEMAAKFKKSEATVRRYVARAREMIIEKLNTKGKKYERQIEELCHRTRPQGVGGY